MYGLFVISAPSGTGKSTLCKKLIEDLAPRLSWSISSTSRKPRGAEQHGVEYFFLEQEEFKKNIEQGAFAEWALVHGFYYGTSLKTLQDLWSMKKHVLLDIDVQGAATLKKTFPDRCLTVFVSPPSLEELERRLRARQTDSEETIQKRMKNAAGEMAQKEYFDFQIVNDQLEDTFQKLQEKIVHVMQEWESRSW